MFKELDKLPVLPEYERRELSIYRPSFTRQKLDYRKTDIPSLGRSSLVKARILYGNETDYNEYPWQVSGGTVCGYCNVTYLSRHVRSRCGSTRATSAAAR